ncbi:hypothetical protein DMN91_002256, partial [Ooceraea biroi]
MPSCCVQGCKNRRDKGFRLFHIPSGERNEERRKKWLELIGRRLTANVVICEVHFDDGQVEQARQDGKKPLRSCAISTLLQKRKKETDEEATAKKAKYAEHVENLESRNDTERSNSEIMHTEPTNSVTHTETSNTGTTEDDITTDTANTLSEKEQIKHLQMTLRKTLRQCSALKRKQRILQQRNVNVEKLFTSDQLNFIANNTQRGKQIKP